MKNLPSVVIEERTEETLAPHSRGAESRFGMSPESERTITQAEVQRSRRPIRILLVEDNPGDIALMECMLAEAGAGCFEIEAVQRLAEGLDRLAAGGIDLVLLDLMLPDAQGIETVGRVRESHAATPLVVLTCRDDEDLALHAMQLGAQDYLVKGSVDGRMLVRAISYAIERTRTECELAEQRRLLAVLLDNIPDRIYFKDAESRFLQLSLSVARQFGLAEPRQALGKTDFDFFADEHAREAFEDEREVMRTGVALIDKVEKETLADGRIFWALTTKMPLRDEQGRVCGTFGISRDFTALKAAEDGLRASEERYARLLNSVTNYVYTVEMIDGDAVATSHGSGCLGVTGYSPEEFNANADLWYRIIHPDDRESVVANVVAAARGADPREIVHRLIRKDGSIRWVQNKQVLRRDAEGCAVSYDGLISDVTERELNREELVATNARLTAALADVTKSHEELKTTQLQLIQAGKLHSIGELAAGVAHDVKNPLSILQTGIQFLAERPPGCEEVEQSVLAEMSAAVARANSVIGGLLAFSSPTGLATQPHSINALIEQSLQFVRHDLMRAGIKVVRHLAADLPECRVVPDKIEQVFVNLFINACHAMPAGGTLTVSTSHLFDGEEAVAVEIRDTGSGIPEDKLPRVFDPFFTTKETGQGTGLGLAVVKKIIDLHRGNIRIRNNPQGGVIVETLFKIEK